MSERTYGGKTLAELERMTVASSIFDVPPRYGRSRYAALHSMVSATPPLVRRVIQLEKILKRLDYAPEPGDFCDWVPINHSSGTARCSRCGKVGVVEVKICEE